MTTLDTLARTSAHAVHSSVASVPIPTRGIVSTTRWFYFRRSAAYAFAGSAAAILAVVALMIVSTPADEVTDVTATTATTAAPTTTVASEAGPATTTPTQPVEPSETPAPVVVPPEPSSSPPVDTVAPRIQILSPDDGVRTKRSAVLVVGLTEPGASVTFTDDRAIDVGEDGAWSTEVRLREGRNVLEFTATDEAGNHDSASVTIVRVVDPPDTTTTTTTKPSDTTTTTKAPAEWEFTAHATYGSCSESPPYDIYYGTGKPGTLISISSEFGGGSTEVGENGEWSLKVFFPEAPVELVFSVKVKDFTGAKVLFDFVSYAGE